MPARIKKGKVSKLARMNDEERARYLQHRAEVELEAKHQKQQLIVIFTKNKLKREEAFARINNAKLNEQWRVILRQMKCTKLKDNIEYFWRNFEEILKMKDNFIKELFDELLESNFDHKRFQEAYTMVIDNIIEKGLERRNYLHNNYAECIKAIETVDIQNLRSHKVNMKEFLMYLKTLIVAKKMHLKTEIEKIKTKHAINIYNVSYDKNESMLKLKHKIYSIIESLWQTLNEIITNYENSTENIRKQCEYLKKRDDVHQIEVAHFPKFYTKLQKHIENLNKKLINLTQERQKSIDDFKMQTDLLTKRVCKLKQEKKMAQTLEAIQLKRLSVVSNDVIRELQKILDKNIEIQTIVKLCSDIKLNSFNIKKYSLKNVKDTKQLIKFNDKPFSFFKTIKGFRDNLYNVKEENSLMRQEYNNLIEENNRLKHCLQTYLVTASKMPTISPIIQL